MRRAHSFSPLVLAIVAVALVAAGCTTDKTATPPGGTAPTGSAPRTAATAAPGPIAFTGTSDATVSNGDRCEFFSQECLLPFPSDHFTKSDDTTATKKRVNLARESMPANQSAVLMDPGEWNRNDGFSPGAMILTKVDGVDLEKTKAPPVTNIATSLEPDSPIVLVDADTGERRPFYAELDHSSGIDCGDKCPGGKDQSTFADRRTLIIRPAVNLIDGHRHVVALRNLKKADGSTIEPSLVFKAYRDKLETKDTNIEGRRRAIENVFAVLDEAKVKRDDLYLAWDFTVASTRNISERILHMRDQAFADLGDKAPVFEVTNVEEKPSEQILRIVEGTVEVPNFLTNKAEPASVLNNAGDANGMPKQDGSYKANFLCVVPSSAEQTPAHNIVYGHGLLGSANEVRGVGLIVGPSKNVVSCATDWIGMSRRDVGAVAAMLGDLSTFRIIPDRLQQAMLDFLFLGRALKHSKGFRTHAAFQSSSGGSLLGDDLAFLGGSQGGIMGGATSAIAQDWTRAFLAVPAMNYSTLLNRSVDFDTYAELLRAQYPDPLNQQLIFSLIQMLWDRGDSNGYANHLTRDPLPNTPAKEILLFAAFGDHQVTNVGTDVMARTIGAKLRAPGLSPGRSTDVTPFWGIDPIASMPYVGSAYVMWDFGTPAPPITNTPNREGKDPHGSGSGVPAVFDMGARFILEGKVFDVCDAKACQTLP